ncbi:MAG TPA: hypothetical protein ENK87_00470 [Nitratifractor sp.]|jgi:prophage DNA circulation protein|nr:hypothetical protein [Nitratifractor sp.]HHD74667.1 hypothetical protein [Nitratifractor sp.]HHH20379.1 hypothetical protein [Nitratifractor sp.]
MEPKQKVEEVAEKVEDAAKEAGKKTGSYYKKCMNFLQKSTEKIRTLVLDFGEIIVTATVIVGLITAVVNGLSTMGNAGFFSGLSAMFNDIVSTILGALVIFLLFAIYKNTQK